MSDGIEALLEISENLEDLAGSTSIPASKRRKPRKSARATVRAGADPVAPKSTKDYAILGKLTAKPKIDGKRVKVAKKVHIIRAGRAICRAENAYKKQPRYTPVESPEPGQVCRTCLGLDNRGRPERSVHPVRRDVTSRQSADRLADDELPTPVSEVGRTARAEALERFGPGEGIYDEPLLAVLMGERMADEVT